MPQFKLSLEGKSTSGIVTLTRWITTPNGDQYETFWAERWEIVPDKAVPLDGFKSAEHWSLAAIVGGDVLMLIPGCKVASWVFCKEPPKTKRVFAIR